MLKQIIVIGDFSGQRDCTDDLYLSTLVDEDVLRMHVANFLLQVLELATCSNDVIQEVPDFSLKEVFFESIAVKDLGPEHEFVVVEGKLDDMDVTLAIPLEPHIPTGSKVCLRGNRMTSLLSESLIWFMHLSQSL